MDRIIEILATALVYALPSDSATYSVVVGDAEKGEYGVRVRYYIDADRAGVSDYFSKEVMDGLSQTEASYLASLLTEAKKEIHARHRS